MVTTTNKNKSLGIQIYLITLIFSSLSIFLQLLPLEASKYFEQTLSISSTNFVFLGSLFFITYSLLQVPAGVLFDRFGIKYVLPSAIMVTTLGIAIFWHASNPTMIAIGRLITGTGCSVAYISGIFAAAKFFPPQRLAILIGILEATSTSGSIAATTPLVALLDHLGWAKSGVVIISFGFILGLLAITTVRGLDEKNNHTSSMSMRELLQSIIQLFKNKKLMLVCFYSFCTWLTLMSFAGYWLKNYLIIVHEYTEKSSLNLIDIYWLSFIVSSLTIGSFVRDDKLAKTSMCILALLGFITYAFMATPVVFPYSYVLVVVIGGGISASGVIIAFSLIPKYVDANQCGTAVALNNTFVVLGGYVGQVLFATLVKHGNVDKYLHIIHDEQLEPHYYTALLIYVFFTLMGLVFALLLIKKDPKLKVL